MRSRLLCLVLAVAAGAISIPSFAAAASQKDKPRALTAQQIRAAVAKAERSPDLWATVNVCTSSSAGDLLGIRGQMPGLSFQTRMSMSISVSYWNYTDNMFESSNVTSSASLGKGTRGIHQGGVNFPFAPPPSGTQYLVRATVTFEWRIGRKVIGQVTRNTGHGYANVGFSNPPGYTSGTCTLT